MKRLASSALGGSRCPSAHCRSLRPQASRSLASSAPGRPQPLSRSAPGWPRCWFATCRPCCLSANCRSAPCRLLVPSAPSRARKRRHSSVLPVPTSPMILMKPSPPSVASSSVLSASWWARVQKANEVSGVSPNGSSARPKWWRYMAFSAGWRVARRKPAGAPAPRPGRTASRVRRAGWSASAGSPVRSSGRCGSFARTRC